MLSASNCEQGRGMRLVRYSCLYGTPGGPATHRVIGDLVNRPLLAARPPVLGAQGVAGRGARVVLAGLGAALGDAAGVDVGCRGVGRQGPGAGDVNKGPQALPSGTAAGRLAVPCQAV